MNYTIMAKQDFDSSILKEKSQNSLSWAHIATSTIVWTTNNNRTADLPVLKGSQKWSGSKEEDTTLLLVIQEGNVFQHEFPNIRPILNKGRHIVIETSKAKSRELMKQKSNFWLVTPLPENKTIVDDLITPTELVRYGLPVVNLDSYTKYLRAIISYPNRHSFTDHYIQCAQWAKAALEDMDYDVQLHEVSVLTERTLNVVAERKGEAYPANKVLLVVAHLDSLNHKEGVLGLAPGADDNASGCAGVLEIARMYGRTSLSNDIRFILFGGEEQGLHGSTHYVESLSADERGRIKAVLNMDMIAAKNLPHLTVLLETNELSRSLLDVCIEASRFHPNLRIQTSLSPYASDHVPFLNASIPAVLTIEGGDNDNKNIHTADDKLDYLNFQLASEIVSLNATIVSLLDKT